jgi:CIC family chloride channel protein
MGDHLSMSIIAVIIGVLGGYGAVLFRWAIQFFQRLFYGDASEFLEMAWSIPWYVKLTMPVIGGAVVGPLIYFGAREAKGHGVPEVMEAVALKSGFIRARVSAVKILASAVSIGCGGSVGREGPIVQIGSAVGSSVGQLLKVSRDRLRTLVGCGAAAGIAATFNAPIAGVLFSIEILLGEFGVATFSPIVLASVTATTISRHYFGDFPAFIVPGYAVVSRWEYLFYLGLGVAAGLIAVLFVITLYWFEDRFDDVPIPEYTKAMLGGLIMGVMIIFLPQTFGVGYGAINQALTGGMVWYMLLVLVFAKILATSITIGGGMSGGIFAPSLFIGAMVGGALGLAVNALFPESTAASGAYALVGMGGLVAAATHAPITAIIIIFELTGNYTIILPLMITCISSTVLATMLKKGNIYTIKLRRRGVVLHRGREQSILQKILVQDVMRNEVRAIKESTFLDDIIRQFQEYNTSYLEVVNEEGDLTGIISFRDIRVVLGEDQLGWLVVAKDVATKDVVTVTALEDADAALRKMGQTGVSQLPVVDAHNPKKVVGVIHEKDITAAYDRAALALTAA